MYTRYLFIFFLLLTGTTCIYAGNNTVVRKDTITINNWQEALEHRVLCYTYSPQEEKPSFRFATLYRANTDVTGLDVTQAVRYKVPVSTLYRGTEEIMFEAGRLEPGDRLEYEIEIAEPQQAGLPFFPVSPVNLTTSLQAIYHSLTQQYTLYPDNSQEYRFTMELHPHIAQKESGRYIHRNILYDPANQQLLIHKAVIKDKKGKEIPLPETALLEILPASAVRAPAWSRLKEVIICYERIAPGSVLILDYSILSLPGYLPELDICQSIRPDFPVRDYRFDISVPVNKPLFYTVTGLPFKEEKRTDSTWQTVTLQLKELPAFLPGQEETLLTVSTYPSTEKALNTLYDQFAIAGDLQLLTLAEALTEDAETEQRQIESLYNYITNRIDTSWLGLPETAFRIRTADEVINSAYGTIPEKVNLLLGLLNALEIKASPSPLFPAGQPTNSFGLSSIGGWSIQVTSGNEQVSLPL